MDSKYFKTKEVSLIIQREKIRKKWEKNIIYVSKRGLDINLKIPSTNIENKEYLLKVIQKQEEIPKTYILKENLDLKRQERIPHIYGEVLIKNKKYIRICTFLPSEDWNNKNYISDTVIFWAVEWIYYFEIWNACGVWNGGGKHPRKSEKNLKKNK